MDLEAVYLQTTRRYNFAVGYQIEISGFMGQIPDFSVIFCSFKYQSHIPHLEF